MNNNPLKILRITQGLSQSELAKQVGVTRQTIVAIESGAYNPTLNVCMKICQILETTLDAVFWNDFFLPNEENKK